ncbi:MAG: methyltransferase domain-containing protein [Candidatus Pacebacteria bacterium]|nr:methyltransferase domain-containing protein [Candidatus Paceibacterota bacterium]
MRNFKRHTLTFLAFPRQLLQIDAIRNFFCYVRWVFLKRKIKTLSGSENDKNIYKETVKFNRIGLEDMDGARTHQLIRPLVSIERVSRKQNQLKVLSIGPRNEAEIFNLWAYGFSLKNITGLDLISYSPYIQIGDMHQMCFQSESFDIVIAGWVLVYSQNPELAAKEIVRVSKDQAIIAVTASYNNTSPEVIIERYGSLDAKRFDTLDSIKKAFDGHIDFIYFQQAVDPLFVNDIASPILIFRVKKENSK